MKFSININQKQALELGITNINQAVIFDLLTGCAAWANTELIGDEVYYWVARQAIVAELPLLNIKADTAYRHLKSLAEIGVIDYMKKGKKDCIRITEKGKNYYVGNKSELAKTTMSEINPNNAENSEINPNYYVGNKSEFNSEINPTYQLTNTNQLKDYQDKEINKEKGPDDKRTIPELKKYKPAQADAKLWESFLIARKERKAQQTERSINGVLRELDKCASLGIDNDHALSVFLEETWKGLKAEWIVKNHQPAGQGLMINNSNHGQYTQKTQKSIAAGLSWLNEG